MSLLHPLALWGLLLLPVIVLLRMLARRPRRRVVPSLIPWRSAVRAQDLPRKRALRLDGQLLLQLLVATLIVLAVSGPQFGKKEILALPLAIVIDNSASMGLAGRLDQARAKVQAELQVLKTPLAISLWTSSPVPLKIAGPVSSAEQILKAIGEVKAVPCGGDMTAALAVAGGGAASGSLLLGLTDDSRGLGDSGAIRIIQVGGPAENLGIVAAALEGEVLFCAVRSNAARNREVAVTLTCAGKTTILKKDVGPGGRQSFIFSGIKAQSGFALLSIAKDSLPADNILAFSLAPGTKTELRAVNAKGAASTCRALSASGLGRPVYVSAGDSDSDPDACLRVYSGLWPKQIPEGSFAIVIDPPPGSFDGCQVTEKRFACDLGLQGAFFPHAAGFKIAVSSAAEMKTAPGCQVLLASEGRALIALSKKRNLCLFAFDPQLTVWVKHPSFPVFFARLLEEVPVLATLRRSFYRTGESIPAGLGSGLISPSGRKQLAGEVMLEPGKYFSAANSDKPVLGVGLLDEGETLAFAGGGDKGRFDAQGIKAASRKKSSDSFSLAPGLFALALLLLAIEWILSRRSGS
jgi:Aerotolerance regulator N-terminal